MLCCQFKCPFLCGDLRQTKRRGEWEAKLKSTLMCLEWEVKRQLSGEKDGAHKIAIKTSQDCGMASRE